MSYHRKRAASLMGLGGAESCGPDQEWDPNAVVAGLPPGQCVKKGSVRPTQSSGGVLDTLVQIGKNMFTNYQSGQRAAGQAAVYQGAIANQGTPGWVMPVVIGGVGIAAVLLLTRK